MSSPAIDYAALAEQARGSRSVDYAALAEQARKSPETEKPGMLSDIGETLSQFWDKVNPVTGAQGIVHAVTNPGETIKGYGESNAKLLAAAKESLKKGEYSQALRHTLGYALNAIPGVGSAIDEAGNKAGAGDYKGAIADTAALATNLVGPQIAEGAAGMAGRAASLAKTPATEFLGATTGAGSAAMRRALEKPTPELVNAMRGNTSETEVLGHFKDALQNVKDARSADYQARLQALPNAQIDLAPIKQSVDFQLGKFGIKKDPAGELDFSRSPIRDASAQADIKSVYQDVTDWGSKPGDNTPASVDILKRRIDDVYSPSSAGRALVQAVKKTTGDALNMQVPGYREMTKGYAQASEFLDQLKDLSLESKNPGTAIRKLTTTLRQNNGYRAALADALGQYTGTDLTGELAGMNLSKAGPQGLARVVDTGVGLLAGVAHGFINPSAAVGIAAASPRLMGELMVAMSKTRPVGRAIGGAAPALGAATAIGNIAKAPTGDEQ